jgi:hypothetical protein
MMLPYDTRQAAIKPYAAWHPFNGRAESQVIMDLPQLKENFESSPDAASPHAGNDVMVYDLPGTPSHWDHVPYNGRFFGAWMGNRVRLIRDNAESPWKVAAQYRVLPQPWAGASWSR